MKNVLRPHVWMAFSAALLTGGASTAGASYQQEEIPRIIRDSAVEQTLRFEASGDTAMSPARFLRWMRHWNSPLSAIQDKSSAEFRPVVNADETHGVSVLATVVYKF